MSRIYNYVYLSDNNKDKTKDAIETIHACYGVNKVFVINDIELVPDNATLYIDDSINLNNTMKLLNKISHKDIENIPFTILTGDKLESYKRYRKMRIANSKQ